MTKRKGLRRLLPAATTALGVFLSFGNAPAMAAVSSASWSQLPIPSQGSLHSVVAFSPTSAFATTWQHCGPEGASWCSQLWQLSGQTWKTFSLPSGFGAAAIAGTGATDAWFLGGAGSTPGIVYHWNGQSWADRSPGVPGYYVQAADAVSATSAWSAGVYNPTYNTTYDSTQDQAAVGRWDGSAWTVTKLPKITGATTTLTAVHASSAGDAWATGEQCRQSYTGNDKCQPYLAHWNGTQWSPVSVPSLTPRSALPTAVTSRGSEVWVAGRETDLSVVSGPDRVFVQHWDGQAWTKAYLPVNQDPAAYTSNVTGLAFHGTDLLAGVSNTLHEGVVDWNGQTWAPYPGPLTTTASVNALVGTANGDVFAAGSGTDATGGHDFFADLPAAAN